MSDDPTFQKSMFSSAVFPARICLSRAVVRAWLESDPASGGSSTASFLSSLPVGSLSKTSLASCHQVADGTWESSSGRWGNWGMGGPTESWTLNGSEWPSDGAACSLSDMLETGPHLQRYCLSPTAARGILRRAEKR